MACKNNVKRQSVSGFVIFQENGIDSVNYQTFYTPVYTLILIILSFLSLSLSLSLSSLSLSLSLIPENLKLYNYTKI